jgi:hypothetical protein
MKRTLLVSLPFRLSIFFLLISLTAASQDEISAESSHPLRTKVIIDPWPPATSSNPSVQDLHGEYSSIFKHGNRNAASHRWSSFLLERADQMTVERLEFFFSGFCAVSGSPVRPNDYNRYRLTLPQVMRAGATTTTTTTFTTTTASSTATGFMHYCCWPCVCDTQDFIRVDTLNVTSSDGLSRQRHFAVIGNPCDRPEQLEVPFVQPFGRRSTTTIAETAREVRCLEGGILEGATLSDHGYIIIGMFFDAVDGEKRAVLQALVDPTPGRVSTVELDVNDNKSILFHDEREWAPYCSDRAANGYNSGMGEIFRKVCAISPIPQEALQMPPLALLQVVEPQSEDPDPNEEPSCDAAPLQEIVS